MIIRFNKTGAIGIVKDIPPNELPPEAWSEGNNMHFESGLCKRITGYETVYNITVSAATRTQGLAESPWFIMPVQTDGDYYWMYAGADFVYAATATANSLQLNKTNGAGVTVTYSATSNIRWNGAVLSGVPIINNGTNVPQVWLSATAGVRLADLQWDASAGTSWASATISTTVKVVTAKVFRTYREFGVALNITEGAINYPRRVRWSHPSTPLSPPETWDESRVDKDAGVHDFEETNDYVIDGLQLRDMFVIYKQFTVWAMQYTGGIFVHQFRKLFDAFGILAANCVCDIGGRHVVVTDNDIVLHDGQTYRSIAQDRVREYFFGSLDSNYFENTFVTLNTDEDEVWICFPESGVSEPWCTRALIWNFKNDTWESRDIRASHIVSGISSFVPPSAGTGTWDGDSGDWDSDSSTWDNIAIGVARRELIAAYPEEMSASSSATYTISQPSNTAKLLRLNATEARNGQDFESYLVRESMTLAASDRFGNPRIDLQDYKHIKRVWPHIRAVDGTVIRIRVGTQKHPTDAVTWLSPVNYTVGTDEFVNVRAMGRLISFEFYNKSSAHWELTGYDIDVDLAGKY